MFLLYVDESGDVGLTGGGSKYFVLSGFVMHELRWLPTLQAITAFRRRLRDKFTLKPHLVALGGFLDLGPLWLSEPHR